MHKLPHILLTSAALAALSIAPVLAATYVNSGAAPGSILDAANPAPTSMPAPAMKAPATVKKAVHVSMAAPHYRPRLSNVLAELNKVNHRIAIDGRRGYLTKAEQASLKRSEQQVRQHAIHTASRQNGVLHSGQYVAFNHQIRDLGKKLHDLADKA